MSLYFTQEPLDKTPPAVVPTQSVTLNVNGQAHTIQIAPWTTLLDALREYMDLTGTKKGCDHGQCGACTVLVNGKRINSCLALATVYEGSEIQTIEGLGTEENLSPLQQAFIDHDAFQCGYCTPGQICSAQGLINEGRAKTEDEVRELMSGNLCRCGAYTNILSAVMEVLHDGQVSVNNGTLVTIPAQPTKSSSVS
jgi:xanthine dehydrogenase YagT iron-sulfur-binding subunit